MKNKIKAFIFDVDGVLLNSRIQKENKGPYGINEELLKLLKAQKSKTFGLYLATNQNQEGAEFIWERLHFKEDFLEIFASCHVGYSKPHRNFYLEVENKLGCRSEEILFIDDREDNVEAALKQGWKAYCYKNLEELKRDILQYL